MTMPIDNFHEQHGLPTSRFTVENTGYKYPISRMIQYLNVGSVGEWTSLGPDDLGNNTQVVICGDGVKENVAYVSESLLVEGFDGAKVPSGDIIDSISIGAYGYLDKDNTISPLFYAHIDKVGLGLDYPLVYPATAVSLPNFPTANPDSYAEGAWVFNREVPANDWGIGTITPEMVNDPEFKLIFSVTKEAGASTTEFCRVRMYHIAIRIYHHTPDPLPPGASTESANLLKMGSF